MNIFYQKENILFFPFSKKTYRHWGKYFLFSFFWKNTCRHGEKVFSFQIQNFTTDVCIPECQRLRKLTKISWKDCSSQWLWWGSTWRLWGSTWGLWWSRTVQPCPLLYGTVSNTTHLLIQHTNNVSTSCWMKFTEQTLSEFTVHGPPKAAKMPSAGARQETEHREVFWLVNI